MVNWQRFEMATIKVVGVLNIHFITEPELVVILKREERVSAIHLISTHLSKVTQQVES